MESIGDYLNKMTSSSETRGKYEELINQVLQDEEVVAFIQTHKKELTTNAVERSAANLYEFVLEKEKARKGEGQLMPGYVPQLILNNKRIEVTYVATEEHLEKRKQEDLRRRINSVYMLKDIKEATFDQFEMTHGRREALDRSIQFVENYIKSPDSFHKGLYLHGAFGVGKTYLLGAIAHELYTFGYLLSLIHYPYIVNDMCSLVVQMTKGT